MCTKKCFVQRKTTPMEVNVLLWSSIESVLKTFTNFILKISIIYGETEKSQPHQWTSLVPSVMNRWIKLTLTSFVVESVMPGLTLLLASWLSWQDLTKFLIHLGDMEPIARFLIRSY